MEFIFDETMKLDGGIDMYRLGKRYKTNESPFGRKVKFISENGHELELELARKYIKKNQILTIKEIYVGSSSSNVEFVELPSKKFNTVMFCDVE